MSVPPLTRVVQDVVIRIASEVISKGLHFLFLLYVARRLGAEGFGVYSFAMAWGLLFMLVAEFGVHTLATREMAVHWEDAPRIFANALATKTIMGLVGVLLFLVSLGMGGAGAVDWRLLALAFVALYFNTFTEAGYSVFRASGRVHVESLIVLGNRVATVVVGITVLALGYGVAGLLWSIAWVNGVTLAVSLFIIASRFIRWARPSWDGVRALWRASLPLGLTGVLTVVYFRMDTVMLGLLTDAVSVGLYNAAHRAIEAFLFIPGVAMAVLLPVFSRLFREDQAQLIRVGDQTLRLLLVLIGPVVAGLYTFADPIVRLVFGAEYAGAAPALQIMTWTLVPIYANAVLTHLLIAAGRQAAMMWTSSGAAVANVGLNLLMIPRMGVLGAAIATLLTEGMLLLGNYGFARTVLPRFPLWTGVARAAVPVVVPVGILAIWGDPRWAAVLLAAVAFVASAFLSGSIDRSEASYVLRATLARRAG